MPDSIKKIDKIDSSIDALINDIEERTINKNKKDLEELKKKISNYNSSYKEYIKTPNIIEFLTQETLNKISEIGINNTNSKRKKDTINDILETQNFSDILSSEKDRIDRYFDYRLVDAYIPQITRCLDLYRDSIISPDSFTDNNINIIYDREKTDANIKKTVENNIKKLKDDFNFDKKAKEIIRQSLVDGDSFVAILKVDDEINKILLQENHPNNEFNSEFKKDELLSESFYDDIKDDFNMNLLENLFIESINKNTKESNDNKKSFETFKKEIVSIMNKNFECVKDPTLHNTDIKNLIEYNNQNKKPVKLKGSIMDILEPERTIVLNIKDTVIGYIYVEKYELNASETATGYNVPNISGTTTTVSNANSVGTAATYNGLDYFNAFRGKDEQEEGSLKDKLLTDLFVMGISKRLDNKIIEKNEQFKEIIYRLLKKDNLLNKRIKITFYTTEQVKHFKLDSGDTYGRSKLSKSMFYAKIFLASLLTETMQKISRGRDKRVVYVETDLDEDIEGSVQSVIRDFKAKEIQADDLQSLSTVLRQVGAFEDYYIPKVDGESPIDLDTISGMDTNVDNDFLQWLLKSMVSGIGVPSAFTDSDSEVDFSRSLVMLNSTFVREIVNKQRDYSIFFSEIFRTLYKNQFQPDEKKFNVEKDKEKLSESYIDINDLKVKFPIPQFLNLNNVNEQISNFSTQIDFIIQTYFGESQDNEELKNEFRKNCTKATVESIDWELYDNILNKCKNKVNKEKMEKSVDGTDDDGSDANQF